MVDAPIDPMASNLDDAFAQLHHTAAADDGSVSKHHFADRGAVHKGELFAIEQDVAAGVLERGHHVIAERVRFRTSGGPANQIEDGDAPGQAGVDSK